ncbi:MAG: YfbM family protein [Lachnospiraceae bacterium]|nr:YfbM family protein [Lachnospiraceae bacterium]
MGIIAIYQQTTDEELEKLKNYEEIGSGWRNVEELQENRNLDSCDIDKMWDALHFLLLGKSAGEPVENNLINEAIVGQFVISEDAFGIRADRVKAIAEALQELNFEEYIEKFNMSDFAKNNIYPDIWEYEDEEDEIIEELRDCFERMKKFYLRMSEKGCAVLVLVC